MCLRIQRIAATLFAGMLTSSASSTAAMQREWFARIPGTLALAIGMGPRRSAVLRVTWPRVHLPTGRQSRQDMQLPALSIGPAWLLERSPDMGLALALHVPRVRQAPPRQRQLYLRLQLLRQPLRSVMPVGKR